MDYGKLLTRSFEITRKYRALWLFGILAALFGGGGGGGGNFSFPGSSGGDRGFPGGTIPQLPTIDQNLILLIVGILACVVIVWMIAGIFFRFVSRGALIGLVHELEAEQKEPTVRSGFKIGLERFWSLFGIAVIVNIPLGIISIFLIVLAAVPLLASLLPALSSGAARRPEDFVGLVLAGGAGSIILLCCVVLLLAAVSLLLRPFYEFFVRECVIGKRGVLDSIRSGYRLVRANVGKVVMLYILAIAIGIGIGILMIPITLVLIGIPIAIGIVVYLLVNSIGPALIVGAIVLLPFILLMIFISGLVHVFESTLWTEGYLTIIKA